MNHLDSQVHESSRVGDLTQRERQVLALLAEGLSVKQIASNLRISTSTVSVHVGRIYDKLGVDKAINAARIAIRCGLIAA
jgi:DNA-binding NarL/FixJ family response regulator